VLGVVEQQVQLLFLDGVAGFTSERDDELLDRVVNLELLLLLF